MAKGRAEKKLGGKCDLFCTRWGYGGWRPHALGDFFTAQKPFELNKTNLVFTPKFRHARYCK